MKCIHQILYGNFHLNDTILFNPDDNTYINENDPGISYRPDVLNTTIYGNSMTDFL